MQLAQSPASGGKLRRPRPDEGELRRGSERRVVELPTIRYDFDVMRLEFRPGHLLLFEKPKGNYVVQLKEAVVLETRAQSRAVAKFNVIRRELEAQFPAQKQTPEEQAENTRRLVSDSLVGAYSFRPPKKKGTAKGTRTFGG